MTGCRTVRRRLPATLGTSLPSGPAAHLASCLACQAEAARYRALGRRLAALGSLTEPSPLDLSATGRDRVETPPLSASLRWVRVAEAALAASTGAIAAGVGTWAILRSRRGPAARPG